MAKNQITPEQHKEKMEKKAIKAECFSNTFVSVLAVLLAIVIAFSVVTTAKTYAGKLKQNVATVNPDAQQSVNGDASQMEDDLSSDNSALVPGDENVGDNNASGDLTDNENSNDADDKEQTGDFASTEELVEYFNTCANKVKTDAAKVVKNYEKRVVGKLVVPSVLQSMSETALNTFMADDTEPIVYDTKEEIRENFIVPNQDYVSRLKAADVAKAECKDNGKEYVIYFKLKDEKNPKAGSGVGAVCDVIETYEIAEKAPAFLKEFSTSYYNCEVTATIDKATGRMVHAVYSTPLVFNVIVEMFGTHNVVAEFTFIKDYTITY